MKILKAIGGFLASLALAFVLVIAVEWWSSIVHPLPPDFDQSMEAMCRHVARYPAWVLALVVPMWSGICFVSCWVARRVGSPISGWMSGILLWAAVIMNVVMLPYPLWFKTLMIVAMPAAACLAKRPRREHSGRASDELPR